MLWDVPGDIFPAKTAESGDLYAVFARLCHEQNRFLGAFGSYDFSRANLPDVYGALDGRIPCAETGLSWEVGVGWGVGEGIAEKTGAAGDLVGWADVEGENLDRKGQRLG